MASVSSKTANNAVAFVNGRVCTMDVKKPWATALVVSPTGDFATVGSDDEIRAIVRRDKLVVYDLRQHFVMPGIHDAHTHLLVASMQKLNECDIGFGSNGETLAGNLHRASCACAYTNVLSDWIIGNFYACSQFPDGVPDRKYLDDRYSDQPVLVRETSCHNVLLNTAGLKRCGIDERETQDPPGGYYKRRADGSLTGEIVEGATRDVWLSLPQAPLAHVKRALEYGIEMCHRFGITSCQEASANTVYLHALKELEDENRLHLSVYPHIVCAPEGPALESEDSLRAVLDIAATFDSKHVRARFVKFFLDGAPLPPDFTQCNLDADGNPDSKFLLLDDDKLFDSLQKYDARGMTCKVHVAGEGSVRRALDIFQKLRNKHPNGPRHELAHCSAVHQDDVSRFAPLRLTAEMSPAIFHYDLCKDFPDLFKWPFNEVHASGARMTIGSDWILTSNPSLFDALAHIVDKVHSPALAAGQKIEDTAPKTQRQIGGEIITRVITLGGAEAVGADAEVGSIEAGKRANFIAVDRDLSQGEFQGATVLKTWFEGRMVYNSNPDGNQAL